MDYSHPKGERIKVAISRQKATDREMRRGALFWNPGGPGGSGLKTRDGKSAPKEQFKNSGLNTVYDLIGFDPRGIGESTPLHCEKVEELPPIVSRPTDADFEVFAAWGKKSEDACDKVDGQKRRFFNTRNTARDMDIMRAALNEKKINYVGYSYGTYLGAVYGSMFAAHLDRSVLDSSMHPDLTGRPYMISKAKGVRRNVEVWASWVAERDKTFGLGTTRGEVMETVETVSAQLAQDPVGFWTQSMFDLGMGDSQHWSTWIELAERVAALRDGEDPGIDLTADAAASKQRELTEEAKYTILSEGDWPSDLDTYREDVRNNRDRYPYGLGINDFMPHPPAFRSFTPPEKPTDIQRDGYPRGLVVQAERDVNTPYEGGVAMADRLDHILLTVQDGQHGQYLDQGNACVDQQVAAYLLRGILPSGPVTCAGGDSPPDVPTDA
ncbi:alpha/beta hydrolase [Streptomyces sp. N35]|uniref:alpha/beta hydrolase n=1 Tax=Streptomyces sp. N35 TaxID=2795730 RepID=UPI0018F4BED2|nr:alpha/beta hydrolase [Streptomyces sp. N35]